MKLILFVSSIIILSSCMIVESSSSLVVLIGGGTISERREERDFSRFFSVAKKNLLDHHQVMDLTDVENLTGNQILERIQYQIEGLKQVIFLVHSHGIKKRSSEISHSVRVKDGDFSLDELIKVVGELKNKNIKTAIIDHSCYSGNTLNLLSKGVSCIMATTSKNRLSYILDTKFAEFNGANLMDYYFSTRKSFLTPSLPRVTGDHYHLQKESLDIDLDKNLFINVDEVVHEINSTKRLNEFHAAMDRVLRVAPTLSAEINEYKKLITIISTDYLDLLKLMKSKYIILNKTFAQAVFKANGAKYFLELNKYKTSSGADAGVVSRRFIGRLGDVKLTEKLDLIVQKIISFERVQYVKKFDHLDAKQNPCSEIWLKK